MPLIQMVEFTDQDEIDGYNNNFNPGIEILAINHNNQLLYPKSSLDQILAANHGLPETQVSILELMSTVEINIPNEEEKIGVLESVVGELYVLDSVKFKIESGAIVIDSPEVSLALVGCIAIVFSGDTDNSNQDFEFYIDGNLVYTWPIVNARYGHISKARTDPLFVLDVGSRLSVSISNPGIPNVQNGHITLYFGLAAPAIIGETFYPTL